MNQRNSFIALVITGFIVALSGATVHVLAQSTLPHKMNYQGIILQPDGSVPPDGPVTLTVAIYDALKGGTALWEETINTTLEGSVFDIQLGETRSIDLRFNKPYYIGIRVNGGQELDPRTPCTTTPYAFRAVYADTASIAIDLDSNAKVVRSLNGLRGDVVMLGVNIDVSIVNGEIELRMRRIPLDSIDFPVGTRAGQALIWNGTKWIADDLPKVTFIGGKGIVIRGDTIENTGDIDPNDDVLFSTQAGGDITGTFLQLKIARKGAQTGDALTWNGTEWAPTKVPKVVFDTASATRTGLLTSTDWNVFNNKQNKITPGNINSTTSALTVANGIGSTFGPNIELRIDTASTTRTGILTSTDWTTFNNKQNKLTPGSLSSITPAVSISNGTGATIGPNVQLKIDTASSSRTGILTSTDWTTFNNKQNKLTPGNLSSITPAVSISNGTGATIGPNVQLKIDTASSSRTGILTSTDWTTFNNKQNKLTPGNLSSITPAVSISNGTGATIGPNVQLKIDTASSSRTGILTSTDWTTFNNKQNKLTPGNVYSLTSALSVANGANATIGPNIELRIDTASATRAGILTSSDWSKFNNKQNAITPGTLTSTTPAITVLNGTASTLGPNVTIKIDTASATRAGILTSTDWNTFNNKQNPITPGNVTSVTTALGVRNGTASTFGPNIELRIDTASATRAGILTSTDWTTFNNKQNPITPGNVTSVTTALGVRNGTASTFGPNIELRIDTASATRAGILTSTDWTTFNNKQNPITPGNVTSVTTALGVRNGTASTFGPNIELRIDTASATRAGILTSTDWNTFNNKQNPITAGNVTSVTTALGVRNGTASTFGPNIELRIDTASATRAGILTSTDWNTFNNKQNPITAGNVTSVTTALGVRNGTASTFGPNIELRIDTASATRAGILTSTDWNTFNNKQNPITAGNVTSVTTALGVRNGTASTFGPNIELRIDTASATRAGILTSTDWTTFNNKMNPITAGNVSSVTPAITITNGNASTFGPNVTIKIDTASATRAGILTSTDWTTFNNKMNPITAGNVSSVTPAITITNGNASTFGPNVTIKIDTASATRAGILTSTDWTTFNNKMNPITAGNVSSVTPAITITNGNASTFGPNVQIKIDTASATRAGILTAADWTTFNNKMNPITAGNVSSVTPAITITNGNASTFGPNVTIKIDTASATRAGILTAADWTTFNNKQNPITAGNVSSVTPAITITNGNASTFGPNVQIKIDTASATRAGILTAADWTTFNNKMSPITAGNVSSVTPAITITNGNASTFGPNVTIKIDTASATRAGILTAADWTTFNNKQNPITAGNVSSVTPAITITNGNASTFGPNVQIKIDTASATRAGILTAADWTTFNNKMNPITAGNVSSVTPAITITNGNASTFGPNVTIKIDTASATKTGIVTSTNWTTFNAKLDSVVVTARLTGKGTTASPLDIARQGANTGEVLKWNGTTWVPGNPDADAWRITGNAGTSSSANFLGTTDLVDLTLKANNTTRLRLNTNGSVQRTSDGNARGANSNDLQVVRGAVTQVASGDNSLIASGKNNLVSGDNSSVVSGTGNSVSGNLSTVLSGNEHSVTASYSAVLSGDENQIDHQYSVILGGHENNTNGTYNLIFGEHVSPNVNENYRIYMFNEAHPGRFGLNREDIDYPIHVGNATTNGNGAYLTEGGVWTDGSSITFKDRFRILDRKDVYDGISSLNINGWHYRGTNEYHIGPFAEEFYRAFGTGVDNPQAASMHVSALDVAGVALRGTQELIHQQQNIEAELSKLRIENTELRAMLKVMAAKLGIDASALSTTDQKK